MRQNRKTENLTRQMNRYAEAARSGSLTTERFVLVSKDLVFAMSKVLKDKSTEFFIPVNEDGPLVWQEGNQVVIAKDEDGKIFIPVYTSEDLVPNGEKYLPIEPCYVFQSAYQDNVIEGVIVNPGCENTFAFEDFLLSAVVGKYMDFDSFTYVDEKTGTKGKIL